MVAIVIILSGLAGLAAAIAMALLGGGFFAILLTYAITGNLAFAIFSGLSASRNPPADAPDFLAEIEADLAAMLAMRQEALARDAMARRGIYAPARRRPVFYAATDKVVSRPVSLFRPR